MLILQINYVVVLTRRNFKKKFTKTLQNETPPMPILGMEVLHGQAISELATSGAGSIFALRQNRAAAKSYICNLISHASARNLDCYFIANFLAKERLAYRREEGN